LCVNIVIIPQFFEVRTTNIPLIRLLRYLDAPSSSYPMQAD
jgi:hypothetical protein